MRHTRAALAALAVAAIMLTGCKAAGGKSAPTQPAAAQGAAHGSASQPAKNTPATPGTSPSGGGTKQTPHRPSAAEGVATAVSFMHREVGMAKPVAGKLRWTGGDTAEVDVHPELPGEAEGHQPWRTGPVTVVSLQRLAKVWYVSGTRTSTIKVASPRSSARVRSPADVDGAAHAFEGNVQVRVTQDRYGKDILLGSGHVTGGGDKLRPFEGLIAFRRPTGSAGSIIFSEPSALDGTAIAATVVRVRFAKAASCDSAAMLPLLKRHFDDPRAETLIVGADVVRCRNGYAHVVAVPRHGPEHPYSQFAKVFLRDAGGAWQILDDSGRTCADPNPSSALRGACRALGYPA